MAPTTAEKPTEPMRPSAREQVAARAASGPAAVPAGPEADFDSQFDSLLNAEQLATTETSTAHSRLLEVVLRGRADTLMPPYTASYGPDANLRFDFSNGLAFLDLPAQRHLRVRRELPHPAPGAQTGAAAMVRRLDEVIWDLGIAAGAHPLMNAPANWWHAPLVWTPDADMSRLSRVPRHLDMARRLAERPRTPSELRLRARVGVSDLRGFVQAGLMLGLLSWQPSLPDATAARPAP